MRPVMKSVRDACELQPDALTTKLSDQIEQLDELIDAEGDGTAFFERTHITQGMQDLISEGIARLAGVSTQAIFHLKQAMGGGKTHLLVGFGLLARQPHLRSRYCGGETNARTFGVARVAAFNGRNSPPYFEDLATRPVGAGTVTDIATRSFANLLTAAGKKANLCVVIALEKFPSDAPVIMTFRKAHFTSGHDLKDFAEKLGLELNPGDVEQ